MILRYFRKLDYILHCSACIRQYLKLKRNKRTSSKNPIVSIQKILYEVETSLSFKPIQGGGIYLPSSKSAVIGRKMKI